MPTPTIGQTKQFWQRAFLPERYRQLTRAESAFVIAATYGAKYSRSASLSSYQVSSSHTAPDVETMAGSRRGCPPC